MTADTARKIQGTAAKTLDPLTSKVIQQTDVGGNMLIKQDEKSKSEQDALTAQQAQDAAASGNMDTRNAATRKASLQYAADSAGATRTGSDADTVSGTSVMTKKKAAARDLGVA